MQDISTQILLTIIVIHWSLFKVLIESLQNSHQKEAIHYKIDILRKINKAIKEWAKFFWVEWLLLKLLQFKIELTCKNTNFEWRYIRTPTKEKPSKFLKSYSPLWFFITKNTQMKGRPAYSGIYLSWGEQQMRFKMFHSSPKNSKSIVLQFKCVT